MSGNEADIRKKESFQAIGREQADVGGLLWGSISEGRARRF
jgi:hypothetical protein